MVQDEITDGERIATLLAAELTARDTDRFGALTLEEREMKYVVAASDVQLGWFAPSTTGEGVTVVFDPPTADQQTCELARAAELKTVVDRFVELARDQTT